MKFKLLLTTIVLLFVLVGQTALAENYGGVSYGYKMKMEAYTHAWFDKTGNAETMICIENRESGFNPKAYNDDDAAIGESVAGLFQIKWPLWAANNPRIPTSMKRFWHYQSVSWYQFRMRLADPVQSIRLAFLLYRHGGLQPWGGGC